MRPSLASTNSKLTGRSLNTHYQHPGPPRLLPHLSRVRATLLVRGPVPVRAHPRGVGDRLLILAHPVLAVGGAAVAGGVGMAGGIPALHLRAMADRAAGMAGQAGMVADPEATEVVVEAETATCREAMAAQGVREVDTADRHPEAGIWDTAVGADAGGMEADQATAGVMATEEEDMVDRQETEMAGTAPAHLCRTTTATDPAISMMQAGKTGHPDLEHVEGIDTDNDPARTRVPSLVPGPDRLLARAPRRPARERGPLRSRVRVRVRVRAPAHLRRAAARSAPLATVARRAAPGAAERAGGMLA